MQVIARQQDYLAGPDHEVVDRVRQADTGDCEPLVVKGVSRIVTA